MLAVPVEYRYKSGGRIATDARYCSTRCRSTRAPTSARLRFTPGDLDRLAEAAGPIAEPLLLAAIEVAVLRGSWQAAAWVLSRRWPQRSAAAAGRVEREPDELDALEPGPSPGAAYERPRRPPPLSEGYPS